MKGILILFFYLPGVLIAQTSNQDSIWAPLKSFAGEWTGIGGGESGSGKFERSYKFIYGGVFIEVNNKSVYPPSEDYQQGEVHEDIGYFSFDRRRNIFVLRQFHKEGFVNQYKLDSISPDKNTIVFVSESIENISNGWRAKETYVIMNKNEFEETFELAEPNKDFFVYSKVRLIRRK